MPSYWNRKVDSNHKAIRDDFRSAGWLWEDLHRLGKGKPDGMVLSPWGLIYLIEVKRLEGKRKPKPSENAKPATKKAQLDFARIWPVHIISSVIEAEKMRLSTNTDTKGGTFLSNPLTVALGELK